MTIIRTNKFIKDYSKLTTELQQRFIKQLKLFKSNQKHPSLNIKKNKKQC